MVGIVGLIFWGKAGNDGVSAAWFDDNFAYRKTIEISAHTANENSVYLNLTGASALDTSASGRFQSDCGDLRFTDFAGNQLPYYIVSGCGSSNTVVHVFFDNFPSGAQTFYVYYGNPGAGNGYSGSDFPTAASGVTFSAYGSEETTAGPVGFWRFDEATGSTARNSMATGNPGTLSGTTLPAWQSGDLCTSGSCLYFNGVTSNVSVTALSPVVKTVSFWVRPATSSASLIQLASGKDIKATGGVIGTNGFTAPSIFVNGKAADNQAVLTGGQWSNVVVTTNTGITADSVFLGKMQNGVLNGFLDEVKFYNYVRSGDQIKADFNSKGGTAFKGAGALLGTNNYEFLSNGLVGFWKFNESSGNATDSSGGGVNLTNNGTTTYTGGKFGKAPTFNGSSKYFSAGSIISSVQTVVFWTKPASTTDNFVNLASGVYVNASSGNLGATGFTDPIIFVNGARTKTISSGVWQLVAVTTTSGISVNAFEAGRANGSYGANNSQIDEVRLYNRSLSGDEISQIYNFAPKPVAYWNFEEAVRGSTVNDVSSNGLGGTWNGPSYHWEPGKFGSTAVFRDQNDFISVSDPGSNSVLDFPTGTEITISAWVYPGALPSSGNWQTIVAKGSESGPSFNYMLQIGNPSGNRTITMCYTSSNIYDCWESDTVSFQNNVWQHIALSFTFGTGSSIRGYFNGKAYTGTWNNSGNSAPDQSNEMLMIDGEDDGAGGHSEAFPGLIDEVKIYNYTRTQKQIVEDMNGGHPMPGSPISSAMDYWKLDQGFGTEAPSSGINKTMGTLTNMASPASVGISGWNINGKVNRAVSFDGTNDFVDLGDLSYSESNSALSWTMWVNPNTLSTVDCFICKIQATPASGKASYAIGTGSSNASAVSVGISIDGNTSIATAETPAGVLANGKWAYVAVVFDGSQSGNDKRLKVYVNGVEQLLSFTGTVPSSTQATTSNARLGASSDATPGWLFSGTIDEVKIYTGALSLSEIKTDMNLGQSVVLGSLGTTADGKTASNSASASYCVPGSTAICRPPIGQWDFEEGRGSVTEDKSGNDFEGTLSGSVLPAWSQGKVGKSLLFDGDSSYVTAGTSSVLSPTNSITLEAWIYPRSWGGADNGAIISKGSIGSTTGYHLYLRQASSSLSMWPNATFDTDAHIDFDKWQHVVAVVDNNVLSFYVNGIYSAPGSWTLTSANSADFRIGFSEAFGDDWFDGFIDQVRVFDYGRTAAQIAWDFNRGQPLVRWKFDECAGTVANDSIGTVNGTLNSGTAGDCNTASTAWYNGKTGKNNYSLSFGSAPNLTTVTSASTFVFTNDTSSAASWGGWFKPTNFSSTQVLMEKGNQLKITADTSGRAICAIYHGGAFTPTTGSGAVMTAGAWNHVLCTYDGSSVKTYINGVLSRVVSDTSGIATGTTTLYVGQDSGGSNQYTGLADDVKIWTYPLSDLQVKMDFNQSSAVRFGPLVGAP